MKKKIFLYNCIKHDGFAHFFFLECDLALNQGSDFNMFEEIIKTVVTSDSITGLELAGVPELLNSKST